MDHLTTTLHQLCELIALDNVDSSSDGAEVMARPAVRDMVIDAAGEVGVLRYRIRLKSSASEPSAEAVSPLALAVDLRPHLPQSCQMQVNGAGTQLTASGH